MEGFAGCCQGSLPCQSFPELVEKLVGRVCLIFFCGGEVQITGEAAAVVANGQHQTKGIVRKARARGLQYLQIAAVSSTSGGWESVGSYQMATSRDHGGITFAPYGLATRLGIGFFLQR